MPNQQDILNNLSKYYASQGKTVAPTVEAIRRYNTPTTVPTPTPATITIPTIDRTAGVGKLGTAQENLASAYSLDSQSRIRRDAELYAANQRQARIDAINATFAPRMEAVKKGGEEQLSRVDAINFKRGITGSGADTTKIGEQKGLNEKAMREVEQEKSMLINDAFNQADKLAVERAALESGQMKEAALANVDLYKQQADKAISALQSFGSQNTSLEDIKRADPKTYDTLKTVSGLSDFEMTNILTAANPKNKILKTEVTSDGTVINVVQKADGTIEVQRNTTDIKPKEEIQIADGVAYGITWDKDKKIGQVRKLTSKEEDPMDALREKDLRLSIAEKEKKANTIDTTKYTDKQDKMIDQINTGVSKNFSYQKVNSAKNFADGVISSLSLGTGLGDIAAINQFQKVIDEGAVTRDQDVKLVQSSQSLVNNLKLKIKKLESGDQLSPTQRKEMENAVQKLYKAKVRSLESDPYIKAQKIKAQQNNIEENDTVLGQLGVFGEKQGNDDEYSDYRSQLQKGEILIKRGDDIMAITPLEFKANDEQI